MIPTRLPIDLCHLTSTNRLHDPWKNVGLKIMPEYGKTDWMKQDSWQLTLLAQLQPMEGSKYLLVQTQPLQNKWQQMLLLFTDNRKLMSSLIRVYHMKAMDHTSISHIDTQYKFNQPSLFTTVKQRTLPSRSTTLRDKSSSFHSLSYDRSIDSSKANFPQSAT
jgi:hypothetical protein